MTNRTQARRLALQVLYQLDVTGEDPDQTHRDYVAGRATGPAVHDFAWALIEGCRARRVELDGLIRAHAQNWSLERMAPVDRNVLRLGVYELLYLPETPAAVAIDEAVELAKRYGQSESGAFVNAVLDAIRKDRADGEGCR